MMVAIFTAFCAAIMSAGLVAPQRFVLVTCAVAGFPMALLFGGTVSFGWAGGLTPQAVYMLAILMGAVLITMGAAPSAMQVVRRNWLYVVFICYVAISIAWAPSLSDAARMLIKWLTPPVFLVATYCATRQRNIANPLATAICAGAVAAVLLAATNMVSGGAIAPIPDSGGLGSLPALTTPMNSPANFCFLIVVASLVAMVRFLNKKTAKSSVLLLLLVAAVLLAFVRIGMAALVGGALAVTVLRVRNAGAIKGLIWVGVIVIGCVFLFSSDAMMSRMFFDSKTVHLSSLIQHPGDFLEKINTSGRSSLWERALVHFKDRSLVVGAGVGAVDQWINTGGAGSELHSEVLRTWIEVGVVGAVLWFAAFVQLGNLLRRKHRELRASGVDTAVVEMAFGSIAAYMLTLLTDNSINYVSEFAIAAFGLAGCALAQQANWNNRNREVDPVRPDAGRIGYPPANFVDTARFTE